MAFVPPSNPLAMAVESKRRMIFPPRNRPHQGPTTFCRRWDKRSFMYLSRLPPAKKGKASMANTGVVAPDCLPVAGLARGGAEDAAMDSSAPASRLEHTIDTKKISGTERIGPRRRAGRDSIPGLRLDCSGKIKTTRELTWAGDDISSYPDALIRRCETLRSHPYE